MQAPAEYGSTLDHGGQTFGDNRHLGDVAPVRRGEIAAAEEVDGLLFPAGLAWQTAWKTDPAFPLYGPDRFHPSTLGTYLAALVVYAEVRDKSPVGLPSTFETRNGTVTIPPAQALLAQKVAAAVTQTKKRPGKPWAAKRGPHADTIADEPLESVE